MIRRFTVLFASMIIIQVGCYPRYTIHRLVPTNGEISKRVEVITKDGQTYILVKYRITEDRLIGYDQDGKRYEEFLDDIERVNIVSKRSTKQKIVVALFVVASGLLLYYYFSVQGFSQLR